MNRKLEKINFANEKSVGDDTSEKLDHNLLMEKNIYNKFLAYGVTVNERGIDVKVEIEKCKGRPIKRRKRRCW